VKAVARASRPLISVVMPTFNRAPLLAQSLEGLARQTLSPSEYEVVVVNDGSTDGTADVCERFASRLQLHYASIANSGISAAKNLGLFLSQAPITLFLDDDDVADSTLLRAHLDAHDRHRDENIAILGYTTWDPSLEITPVMEYVTEIGQLLFSYRSMADGQKLDYTYFWGGRSSCKRRFLSQHGIFNQDFRAIIEDIELAYRLSKHGLRVVHARAAASFMVRPITFADFCQRCERQGEALRRFSTLHPEPEVQEYCRVAGSGERWTDLGQQLPAIVGRVLTLEADLTSGLASPRENALAELRELYSLSFEAYRIKGAVSAAVPQWGLTAIQTAAPAGAP
jgi:cellulose synthase/poly-beta-1,6-N-acetylglucosamine synthase-like glycosyltransferase